MRYLCDISIFIDIYTIFIRYILYNICGTFVVHLGACIACGMLVAYLWYVARGGYLWFTCGFLVILVVCGCGMLVRARMTISGGTPLH